MFLSEKDQEMFSSLELEVIETIGKEVMTLKEIAERIYGSSGPKYGSTSISVVIGRINDKARKYGLNFKVDLYGSAGGRIPKKVKIKSDRK